MVREYVRGFAGRDGEGHECGRHVERLKAAAHGILAADGGDAEIHLRAERAEQGGQRLAPARFVAPELFKILLEAEVHVAERSARGDESGDGLHDREIRAVVGALL